MGSIHHAGLGFYIIRIIELPQTKSILIFSINDYISISFYINFIIARCERACFGVK